MAQDRARKVSELAALAANGVANGDLFMLVDVSASETKKITANNMATYFVGLVNKGEKGDSGATGSTGDKGQKGEVGEKGATGSTGTTGSTGAKGQKGEVFSGVVYTDANNTLTFTSSDATSNVDVTGVKGEKGQKGELGSTGSTGSKGDKGDLGSQGSKGDTGTSATGNVAFSGSNIYETSNNTIQIGPQIMGVNFIQLTGQSEADPALRIAGSAKNGSNGGVQIETGNNGADFLWRFGANGQMSFPDSSLQGSSFRGSVFVPIRVTTNTYTANANAYAENLILVELTTVGSNCNLTLPISNTVSDGRTYTIKIVNNSGHILNVTTTGGGSTIEDTSTGSLTTNYSMNNLGQSHTWVYDSVSGVYRHVL